MEGFWLYYWRQCSHLFEMNNSTVCFFHYYCIWRLTFYHKLCQRCVQSHSSIVLSTTYNDFSMAPLFPSVSCSISSPGLYYICLLIGCVSIPAEKFNTSLKPSAKPESFSEEQAIKGMLAWRSCWLIYWLAGCGWLLVLLSFILLFGWVFACDVSPNCHFWRQNDTGSWGCNILCFTEYWLIHFAHVET